MFLQFPAVSAHNIYFLIVQYCSLDPFHGLEEIRVDFLRKLSWNGAGRWSMVFRDGTGAMRGNWEVMMGEGRGIWLRGGRRSK